MPTAYDIGTESALEKLGFTKEAFGGRILGGIGKGLVGELSRLGTPKVVTNTLLRVGKGSGREAFGFGLFGGGTNAAFAEPGERLDAFGRGFAGGMTSGGLWRGGGNIARMGLYKGLGKHFMPVSRAARPGFTGTVKKVNQGANFQLLGKDIPGTHMLRKPYWQAKRKAFKDVGLKSIGAKTLLGGVPLAAGIGASSLVPHDLFEKAPARQQRPWQQQQQPRPNYMHPLYYTQGAQQQWQNLGRGWNR